MIIEGLVQNCTSAFCSFLERTKMKKQKKVILTVSFTIVIVLGFLVINFLDEKKVDPVKEDLKNGSEIIPMDEISPFIYQKFGNEKNLGVIEQNFAILYSSPFYKGSEILILNSENQLQYTFDDLMGLGGITEDPYKHLWLNGIESKSLFSYNPSDGTLKDEKALQLTNYFDYSDETKVVIFKDPEDALKNQLIVQYENKEIINETLQGYVSIAKSDGKYVYAFADFASSDQSSGVYIFDLKTGEMVRKVEIAQQFAETMEFFGGNAVFSTKGKLTVINQDTLEVSYIEVPSQGYEVAAVIKASEDKLLATFAHDELGMLITELNRDLKVQENYKVKFPYVEAFVKGNALYVLGPIENDKGYSGILGKFNLNNNYEKEAQLLIPDPQNEEIGITAIEILSD